jgi:hypothetical protein
MDDLRGEIRAAFEKEQAGHPPAINLRHEVVRAAARQPRQEMNLQWLAVAAALVIGALVVVSLMSTRIAGRTPAPSHPQGDYGTPPAGMPLVYVSDPQHEGWFIGFDWTGRPRGTVKPGPHDAGILMAPDGHSFAVGMGAKGGNWQFLDRLGHPLASGSMPGAYSTMWADDNKHICAMTMDPQTLEYMFWRVLPGQEATGTSVARDAKIGQTSVGLAACSFRTDRAIAVRTSVAWPTEVWVIGVSSGRILEHHTYPDGLLASVVASADAKYLAETSAQSTMATDHPALQTQIRRVSDWSVLAGMDALYTVLSFSGDDTSVLVRTNITQQGTPSRLAIFTWGPAGSLRTVWQYQGLEVMGPFTAEPSGDGFALGLLKPGAQATEWCGPGMPDCKILLDILIVHGDGSTVQLPDRYNTTW